MILDQSSRWRAGASPGGLVGLVLTILAIMAVAASALGLTGRADLPLPDVMLWAVLVAALIFSVLLAFLVWAYLSIGYQLGSENLEIRWGLRSHRVPLTRIESISPLTDTVGSQTGGWQPLWPGYYVGKRQTDIGTVDVIATLPPRRQVLITVSDGRLFAISPERPLLFMEEFARWHPGVERIGHQEAEKELTVQPEPVQQFVEAGWTTEYSTLDIIDPAEEPIVIEPYTQVPENPAEKTGRPVTSVYRSRPSSTSPMLRPIILRDPVALVLIALGFLATAAMAVYILIEYQDIPPSITLHWNVDGLPGRVGEPREIWILPTIAGLVLIANLGLAWSIALFDRFASRMMLGSTVIVHLVTWVALLMLLR